LPPCTRDRFDHQDWYCYTAKAHMSFLYYSPTLLAWTLPVAGLIKPRRLQCSTTKGGHLNPLVKAPQSLAPSCDYQAASAQLFESSCIFSRDVSECSLTTRVRVQCLGLQTTTPLKWREQSGHCCLLPHPAAHLSHCSWMADQHTAQFGDINLCCCCWLLIPHTALAQWSVTPVTKSIWCCRCLSTSWC
jgi:hypothetical protein